MIRLNNLLTKKYLGRCNKISITKRFQLSRIIVGTYIINYLSILFYLTHTSNYLQGLCQT